VQAYFKIKAKQEKGTQKAAEQDIKKPKYKNTQEYEKQLMQVSK